MKRCLYMFTVLIIIWSLAACCKAVSSRHVDSETEEVHLGYVDENQQLETENSEEITTRTDKVNVGLAQCSNLYEWQVAQTESFYTAFTETDGYHLNIVDAHGDALRQIEQLEALVEAPMDVLFIVPVGLESISDIEEQAENAGIKVFLLSPEEGEALNGEEARRQLENSDGVLTGETDKKRKICHQEKNIYRLEAPKSII